MFHDRNNRRGFRLKRGLGVFWRFLLILRFWRSAHSEKKVKVPRVKQGSFNGQLQREHESFVFIKGVDHHIMTWIVPFRKEETEHER
jgi:hypothetical protein